MKRFLSLEYLAILFPAILICVAAVWFTLRYVKPAPPSSFAISAASPGSPYYDLAARFKEEVEKKGIKLEIRESQGSLDNLKALKNDNSGVTAGIVQGGLSNHTDAPQLLSMGRLLIEPVWIFYRGQTIERLTQLKGKRILVGPEGSGTSYLARKLLEANGVTADNSRLIALKLPSYPEAFSGAAADAGFLVIGAEAETVQRLLHMPDVKLMNMAQAEALMQRYPYLTAVALRQGVIDFPKNIPPVDTLLVATKAMLLVRDDLHPALRTLLADAVLAVQGKPMLKPTGEARLFPLGTEALSEDPEFTVSDDVRRIYKSGPTFFQRVLPFWVATLFDRAFILLLPMIGLIFPLFRLVPALYNWRMGERILRWYRALKLLERDLAKNAATPDFIERKEKELDLIEQKVWQISVPDQFAANLYTLRDHVEFVRRRIAHLREQQSKAGSKAAPVEPSLAPAPAS